MAYTDGFERELSGSVHPIARQRMTAFIVEHNVPRQPHSAEPSLGFFNSALNLQNRFNTAQPQPYPDDYSQALLVQEATHLARHVLVHEQAAYAERPLTMPAVFEQLLPLARFTIEHFYMQPDGFARAT